MALTYYLKIDGIWGDSISKGHEGWFDLGAFSLGESNPGLPYGAGAGAGKTSFSDLSVVLSDNTGLTALLSRISAGQTIGAVEIEGVNEFGQVLYDLTLNDVLVSSLQQGVGQFGPPSTSLTFNYRQIGVVTNTVRADGTLDPDQSFGWDLDANTAIDPAALDVPVNVAAPRAADPVQYFVKIDGIAGNSISKGHEGWFELSSFSYGGIAEIAAGVGGSVSSGKTSFSDIAILLEDNAALAALLAKGANGSVIAAFEIEGVGPQGQIVYDLTLNQVRVTSVSQSDSEGRAASTSVSVNYGQIGIVTTSINGDGSLGPSQSFGWDVTRSESLDPATLTAPTAGSTASVPDPVTYFLKIAGVAGDSMTKGYEGWFEISALSLGESVSVSDPGGGGAVAKPNFQDIFLTLANNASLTALMLNNALGSNDGKFLPAIEIEGVTSSAAGPLRKVYEIILNDVIVSSVSHGDSVGGEASTGVSFNYGKIGLTTTSYNADGTIGPEQEFGWDVVANTALDPDNLLAATGTGATDMVPDPTVYYLKIDGVAGTSIDKGHEGWFEIDSYSFGQSNGSSVLYGAGVVNFQDISVTLSDNTALAALLSRSIAGQSIVAIEIEGVAGDRTVYDLTLNDVLVSSVQQGTGSGRAPSTSVSFNFGKIGLVTTGLNGDGTIGDTRSFGWDVAANARIADPTTLIAPTAGSSAASPDPVTYYVKIAGIRGDAISKGHEGWFELPAFSFGESVAIGGGFGGGGAGKANFQDLNLVLADNSALAQLLFNTAAGKFLPALEIEGVTDDNVVVYDLTLNNVVVSAVQSGGNSGSGSPPVTQYGFGYGQIGLVTTSLSSTGTVAGQQSFGWDLVTNQAIDPALLAAPANAPGEEAGDPAFYYIKIDGVVGDATSKGHEGWFALSSFSYGATNFVNASAGGGAGAGQVNFQDVYVALEGAGALTALMGKSSAGQIVGAIEIEGVATNGQVVYDLTLNNILVSSVFVGGSEFSGLPSVVASFAFTQIGLVTTVLVPDGNATDRKEFGWDLELNAYVDPDELDTPTNAPPAVAITSQVLTDDTGALGSDLITSNGQVTLGGTASDDGAVTSVHLFDGATDLGAAVLVGTNWTFATTLGAGTHALKAVATDNSGNVTETALQPQITVDTTAPGIDILSQTLTADTGASGDLVTSDGRVTLTGIAMDATLVASVHVFDGLTDLGAATISGANWSFSTTLTAGSHALRAIATDTAGNIAESTVQAQIAVDATGPTVEVTSQALSSDSGVSGSDLVTANGAVTLIGSVSDASAVASVHVFDGETDLGAATVTGTGWSFATTLAPGTHALRAVATDIAGNVSQTAPQPQILVDTTAPSVAVASQVLTTDTGISASDLVTSDGRVTLTGTAADPGSIASLRVFDGTTDLGAIELVGENWTFSTTLAVGTHALRVVAIDAAGNEAATVAQPQITVVTTDPVVGQPGQTVVNGTGGSDEIYFGTSNLLVTAGGGDDMISFASGTTSGFHYVDGGTGSDTLDLSRLTGGSNINLATGIATGPEVGYTFLSSVENVIGGSGADVITASNARNTFTGGAGSDRFVFATLDAARNGASFTPGTGDVIKDFYSALDGAGALHDTIDLRGIDAIQGRRDDPFTFIATPWNGTGNQFTAAGQLRVQYVTDGLGQQHTIISGNVNAAGQGNGLAADFQIDLLGYHVMSASDFML